MVIAVDGPAGAGKSSIAKIVAKKLGLLYIDSGAIYRSVTKKILDSNIKIDDYARTFDFLESINLDIIDGSVYVDGVDYSGFIREKSVTDSVSIFSANRAVRGRVNRFLNSYSVGKSLIMDGRDIGSEVFPDADFKFYLDASVDERASRRIKEITFDISFEEVKKSIEQRDYNDMHREIGPLKCTDDAVYIDTTRLSVNEVVDKIINCIK